MDKDIAVELIRIAPTVAALIAFLLLFWRYHRQFDNLLSRIGSIKAFGVEAEFATAREQLSDAVQSYGLTSNETELNKVIERANRIRALLSRSRILWVDDRPLANASIFRFLNAYGVVIDSATSTEEALDALQWAKEAYNVIVTDMVRGNRPAAGLDLIQGLKDLKIAKRVIVFVARLDPEKSVPSGAAAITNSPIKLIHEIMNSVESES